jgi:hypothetical protein
MRRVLMAAVAFSLFLGAMVAWASEPVVCALPVGAAVKTTMLPDAGACNWQKGSNLLMQCGNDVDGGGLDVYVDTQKVLPAGNILADGGWYYDGGTTGGVATSADQRINFSVNMDPYILYLDEGDQHVSVLAVAGTGTCKFMTTRRPKPSK